MIIILHRFLKKYHTAQVFNKSIFSGATSFHGAQAGLPLRELLRRLQPVSGSTSDSLQSSSGWSCSANPDTDAWEAV